MLRNRIAASGRVMPSLPSEGLAQLPFGRPQADLGGGQSGKRRQSLRLTLIEHAPLVVDHAQRADGETFVVEDGNARVEAEPRIARNGRIIVEPRVLCEILH